MNNAEYVARWIESKGVSHVFELIGGMITFMLDALERTTDVKIISMHHEQGASFAAEGWARMKEGIPGVAMATSGPGATNLVTAIGSCYFDSVPAIFITGQVNRHEQKGDRAVRQLGFQETDIVSMVKPITKAAWLVNDPLDLPAILDEAFRIATSGRPGPVLVDIPMDVQRFSLPEETNIPLHQPFAHLPATSHQHHTFKTQLQAALAAAKRPLILAGGGIRSSLAATEFQSLVEALQVPVVHSLMGVDVLPTEHPLHFGLIGSYGNRWANLGLSKSDLILVLGSRLDIRQTGSDLDGFRGERKFFHVDCEQGELNNRVKGCTTLISELRPFLSEIISNWPPHLTASPEWLKELNNLRDEWPDSLELIAAEGINPNTFLHQLSLQTPWARSYVADVGQHQMWAAQSLRLRQGQRFLTSGGMGAMGFALPAAIGAAIATGPTVMIAGDGGFQLNIQELQTVRRNGLPLKMVILNNYCHGMVRQFQESYFNKRYQSTLWGYDAPSFVAVAKAYGISASAVSETAGVLAALADLCSDPYEPYLLEVELDTMTNAYPKMAFGRTFGEMEPSSKPLEMEAT